MRSPNRTPTPASAAHRDAAAHAAALAVQVAGAACRVLGLVQEIQLCTMQGNQKSISTLKHTACAEFWASCKKSDSAVRGAQAGIVGRHVQTSQRGGPGRVVGGVASCPETGRTGTRAGQPLHSTTHPGAGCPCSHPPATGSQRHRPSGTWRPAAEQQGRTLGGSNGSSVGFTCSCHHAASNWRLHEGPMEPSAMPTLTRTSIVARSRALVSRSPRCCTCKAASMAAGQHRHTSGRVSQMAHTERRMTRIQSKAGPTYQQGQLGQQSAAAQSQLTLTASRWPLWSIASCTCAKLHSWEAGRPGRSWAALFACRNNQKASRSSC